MTEFSVSNVEQTGETFHFYLKFESVHMRCRLWNSVHIPLFISIHGIDSGDLDLDTSGRMKKVEQEIVAEVKRQIQ